MYLYSKSQHAMYLESINYTNLPDDVIDITKEEYKKYWVGKPPEGYQLKKHAHPFEFEKILGQFERIVDGVVVTDTQAKYEAEVQQVANTRESLYVQIVDRLNNEARMIRRVEGDETKAAEYEAQADAAYLKIRTDHPWPELPI
ncbi:hypothetical protein KW448_02990 [Vibrio fluvialis]|nr:hypothetical protein [Vibrio fluvialis]